MMLQRLSYGDKDYMQMRCRSIKKRVEHTFYDREAAETLEFRT